MLQKIKTITNRLLAAGIVLAVLIGILIGVDFYQKAEQKKDLGENLLLKAPKERIIDYKIVSTDGTNQINENINEEEKSDSVVKYRYISNVEVPAGTYQNLKEDVSKRTNNSQTFLKAIKPIDDKWRKVEYMAKFYSSQTFQKSDDRWYYVETATTTPTAFASQTKLTLLDQVKKFFGQEALADSIAAWSGAGDGYVENDVEGYSWTQTHDDDVGSSSDSTGSAAGVRSSQDLTGDVTIHRAFLPFDTSSIPSNTNMDSALLGIYVTTLINGDNDGDDFIRVVQTDQPDSTTLTTADFNNCGATDNPTAGAADIDLGDFESTPGYTFFTPNATGLGWIKRSGEVSNCGSTAGVTCLGLREGHDVVDSAPFLGNSIAINTSEVSGIDTDPFLLVNYSAIEPTLAIDGGTIKIDGGTVKID